MAVLEILILILVAVIGYSITDATIGSVDWASTTPVVCVRGVCANARGDGASVAASNTSAASK